MKIFPYVYCDDYCNCEWGVDFNKMEMIAMTILNGSQKRNLSVSASYFYSMNSQQKKSRIDDYSNRIHCLKKNIIYFVREKKMI